MLRNIRRLEGEIDADSMNYSINGLSGYYGRSEVKLKRKTAQPSRLLKRNHVAKPALRRSAVRANSFGGDRQYAYAKARYRTG